jgi:hypothetical protein
LRVSHIIAALLMVALSPAALAQKSSGHMDLEDMSGVPGSQLAVFRVAISKTDAICPQQIGTFRIRANDSVTDIVTVLPGGRDWRMDETTGPDDFTERRRVSTDSCRIDIDISEQQQRNGEWVPLLLPSASRPNATSGGLTRKIDDSPALSPAELEAHGRNDRARLHAGSLRQGVGGTFKSVVGFEGMQDCFEAVGTYLIDQGGVTLLFPTGLGGELNRFAIERVDVDADHSTLYLSRGSCRVGFTISASILREGSWVPLAIAPINPSK